MICSFSGGYLAKKSSKLHPPLTFPKKNRRGDSNPPGTSPRSYEVIYCHFVTVPLFWISGYPHGPHGPRHATSKSKKHTLHWPYIPIQVLLLVEKKNHTLARSFLNLSHKKIKKMSEEVPTGQIDHDNLYRIVSAKETTRIGNCQL